jgi:hypothetical protein
MLKRKTYARTYNTDVFMKNLWCKLVEDFRSLYGDQYALTAETALKQGMPAFRAYDFPGRFSTVPHLFKREYQLECLFKRYRFSDDLYNEDELDNRTNKKFFDHQITLATPRGCFRNRTSIVLQRARQIIKRTLGPYNPDELLERCRFGKRACKGTPARNSYLDSKLDNLTGSIEHLGWFVNTYLPTDPLLSAVIFSDQKRSTMTECDVLDVTNVDKSWKIKRGIVPNTTIGSFYTYGLGAIFQDRLKEIGLDITRLQSRHRLMACKYSRSRTYVTADLSNASNSFTYEILARLLPREWLAAVKFGRIPYVEIKDGEYAGKHLICSYMLMGIGYTFPLQTLLFYSIIRAVMDLLGEKGLVSVYGDDLIYKRSIHAYVVSVFEDMNFTLNGDKTYVTDFFRESCGGDYYRGIDVRPFQPQGKHQDLSRAPFVCLLYKTANGLLQRWDECEISKTLHFIYSLIASIDSIVFQVPSSFPDYSGIQVGCLKHDWFIPWSKPNTYNGITKFPCYRTMPDDRLVINEAAYYWDSLRAGSQGDNDQKYSWYYHSGHTRQNWWDDGSSAVFRLVRNPRQPKNYRSMLTGRRLIRHYLCVAKKGSQKVVRQQSVSVLH